MSGNVMFANALIVLLLYSNFCEISANICGTVQDIDPDTGEEMADDRTAWPFLAALFSDESDNFICDGSLISANAVLTAAHCLKPKNSDKSLEPRDLIVLLGAYNLDDKVERGTRQKDVDKIYVHPDWKASSAEYAGDLAILKLSGSVKFTAFIRPICMPYDDVPKQAVGSIVGYAQSHTSDPIPLEANSPVSNDSYCTTTQTGVASLSSQRTFCGKVGTSVKGDVHGGFFVRSDSIWIQFGILSTITNEASDAQKQPDVYALYTNLWAFRNWIGETVRVSGYRDFRKTVEIDLDCDYRFLGRVYQCAVLEANLLNENFEVHSFTGTHSVGYADRNVTAISFPKRRRYSIPDGIGQKFKYLQSFIANFGRGLRRLHRSNFEDMVSLAELHVGGNNIADVDEDTLRDLPNLETFVISKNKLKVLHQKTFDKNFKLKNVYADDNRLEFLHKELFKHTPLLKYVYFGGNQLKEIRIDFTLFKYISGIYFSDNVCINEDVDGNVNLSEFQNRLKQQCGTRKPIPKFLLSIVG